MAVFYFPYGLDLARIFHQTISNNLRNFYTATSTLAGNDNSSLNKGSFH